jgi:hypothetical protein
LRVTLDDALRKKRGIAPLSELERASALPPAPYYYKHVDLSRELPPTRDYIREHHAAALLSFAAFGSMPPHACEAKVSDLCRYYVSGLLGCAKRGSMLGGGGDSTQERAVGGALTGTFGALAPALAAAAVGGGPLGLGVGLAAATVGGAASFATRSGALSTSLSSLLGGAAGFSAVVVGAPPLAALGAAAFAASCASLASVRLFERYSHHGAFPPAVVLFCLLVVLSQVARLGA